MTDRTTGLPVRLAWVFVRDKERQPSRWRLVVSSGHFLIKDLPAGEWTLCLGAPTQTNHPPLVEERLLSLKPGEVRVVDFVFDPREYHDPPRISVRIEYTGLFVWGFEYSQIKPAPAGLALMDGQEPEVWVDFADESMQGSRQLFRQNVGYSVRFRGTLSGPGKCGHLGHSDYEFLVDEVCEYSEYKG